MANLNFLVSNTTPFVGQPSAALFGKNGAKSSLGTVKPLVLNTELLDKLSCVSPAITSNANPNRFKPDNREPGPSCPQRWDK